MKYESLDPSEAAKLRAAGDPVLDTVINNCSFKVNVAWRVSTNSSTVASGSNYSAEMDAGSQIAFETLAGKWYLFDACPYPQVPTWDGHRVFNCVGTAPETFSPPVAQPVETPPNVIGQP